MSGGRGLVLSMAALLLPQTNKMNDTSKMKVKELKATLKARGLKTSGLKAELVARLSSKPLSADNDASPEVETFTRPAPKGRRINQVPHPTVHALLQAAPHVSPLDALMKEIVLGRVDPSFSGTVMVRENGFKKQKT